MLSEPRSAVAVSSSTETRSAGNVNENVNALVTRLVPRRLVEPPGGPVALLRACRLS